ncbi:MAG: trypsin-like peptidase domain-containing protein [Bacteroidota bacterium]|jgi:S1-C subfamily serine protease
MRFFLLLLFSASFFVSFSQNMAEKIYFDKNGKSATSTSAYYYRVPMDGDGNYKSFYQNGGALFFEGKITKADRDDESKNKYDGLCKWYYKNGKNRMIRTFNSKGQENGTSSYYFETGKIQKEIEYTDGSVVNNRYKEFDESGSAQRIFEEDFSNNNNDWDLYVGSKSASQLYRGSLELTSFTDEGTSRYISVPIESKEFIIEAEMNTASLKDGDRAGIIYGFKDWQNFHYFFITNSSFYAGTVYEGVSDSRAEGMFCSSVVANGKNNLKILTNGDKILFSVNGEIQLSSGKLRNFGSNVGVLVTGKSAFSVDKLIVKELEFSSVGNDNNSNSADVEVKASGTGLLFTKNGYILTNHHVIENSNKVIIEFTGGNTTGSYSAKVVTSDKENDVAILKIDDPAFKQLDKIPFSFKEGGVEVGASVFTIGYPYALSGMGKEAKFTDGKVSAKTGYNNAINSFQTSIPVQPGNSGGPVFTEKCQLTGLISATIRQTDNVSYAVKLNYIKNLIELLPETIDIPNDQSLSGLSLEEKIKALSKFSVLIKIK